MIRRAQPADLTAIVDALGQEEFFADRIERQRRDKGVLLTAWADGQPVGGVYIWLEPADEPEVRTQLPGVPLLNRLEVVKERRNGGIGTQLVEAAERFLADHGHSRVALAVEKTNADAFRLYERLGYQDWRQGDVTCYSEAVDEDGRPIPEQCFILVKRLNRNNGSC